MSGDEFDPYVERLFARTPHLPDADLFAAGVEAKLASGARVRTLALGLAGLIGGAVAVGQSLDVSLNLATDAVPVASRTVDLGVEVVGANLQDVARSGLDQLGLAELSLGSMSGMQLFWLAAGALIALAAAAVVRLSQEA